MNSIVLQNISKSFDKGRVAAVRNISLEIRKGELFGIIGPDGAGKTSLFRMLTTLLTPDEGQAFVGGYDVVRDYREIRRRVGYMPGKFSLYPDLTVEENLEFFAAVFSTTIQENYHLIREIYIQLEPFKNRKAGKLSGGMKQKLALCCALIHKPEILFLDEPTTGVDTVSRKEFWQMLQGLKQQQITIVVSTPYMDEAMLCERIALMQDGQVMQIDTPDAIIAGFPERLFGVAAPDMSALSKALNRCEFVASSFSFGVMHHVTLKPQHASKQLRDWLLSEGISECVLEEIEPTIEDCFIKLMRS